MGPTDFQNSPPFERSACFYVIISGNFQCFQYFNFGTDFLESKNLNQKTGELCFSWKHWKRRLTTHDFHVKLPYLKPMLRQIEWWVQNGPITKNGVLPVKFYFHTSIFIRKVLSSHFLWYLKWFNKSHEGIRLPKT